MRSELIGAKGARLEGNEPRSNSGEGHIGRRFALEHLAHENQLAAFTAKADAITNHPFSQHGCKFGGKVAHLIGVGEKHKIGLYGFDDLPECRAVTVRRVSVEQVVLNQKNFRDVFPR